MANSIISDDTAQYYVQIRESELPAYRNLLKLAQKVYDRGMQEGWIDGDLYADFLTSKEASIDRLNRKLIQKAAAIRFFSRLSVLMVKNYSIHDQHDKITAEEYVTFSCLLDELNSFTRNELFIALVSPYFK